MDNSVKLLLEAARKSSKFLSRDFFELESLQISAKNSSLEEFANQSCMRIAVQLKEFVGKYYPNIFFGDQEARVAGFEKNAAFIEVMDGYNNFCRSLPYFGMILTVITEKDAEKSAEKIVMNFPVLNETFYAIKGKGTWRERHSSNFAGESRVRVSKIAEKNHLTIGTTIDYLSIATSISSNVRLLGSYAYLAALVASGKLDLAIVPNKPVSASGIELLIKESGGKVKYSKNMLVLANSSISESLFNEIT